MNLQKKNDDGTNKTGLTIREKLENAIAVIEQKNPKLHAVSMLFKNDALQQAEKLDALEQSGAQLGPLHGVPILFKELIDIAGYRTGFGSNCYTKQVSEIDAPVVNRLRSSGAIILGTTHMVEFAVGSWGTNAAKGTPVNPADAVENRTAGGSSSGSGVAVSAGFTRVAFGSDTGGSIRIPATLCGVVGYKPTYGLIPLQGVAATGPTFDTLGPITKSVGDARLATEVAAGIQLSHPAIEVDKLKIACVSDDALMPIDQRPMDAYKRSMKLLENAGASFTEIQLPLSFVELQKLNGDIVAFEVYNQVSHLVNNTDKRLDPCVRERVLMGAEISYSHYVDRLNELASLRRDIEQRLEHTDCFILPGTPITAPKFDEVDETSIPLSRYTRTANCFNQCAIALPVELEQQGLPVGIQLSAPAFQDGKLLAIAEVFEKLRLHHNAAGQHDF